MLYIYIYVYLSLLKNIYFLKYFGKYVFLKIKMFRCVEFFTNILFFVLVCCNKEIFIKMCLDCFKICFKMAVLGRLFKNAKKPRVDPGLLSSKKVARGHP